MRAVKSLKKTCTGKCRYWLLCLQTLTDDWTWCFYIQFFSGCLEIMNSITCASSSPIDSFYNVFIVCYLLIEYF